MSTIWVCSVLPLPCEIKIFVYKYSNISIYKITLDTHWYSTAVNNSKKTRSSKKRKKERQSLRRGILLGGIFFRSSSYTLLQLLRLNQILSCWPTTMLSLCWCPGWGHCKTAARTDDCGILFGLDVLVVLVFSFCLLSHLIGEGSQGQDNTKPLVIF